LIFVTTEDWYFLSHRAGLARDALAAGFDVVLATRVGAARAELDALGVRVIDLPWRRGGRPSLGDLRALARLTYLYQRERPALVHHVALKSILIGSLAARLSGARRVINAVAGLGYVFTDDGPRARAFRKAFGIVGPALLRRPEITMLFQNRDDQARLAEILGLSPELLELVPGAGVDLQRFRPSPEPAGTEIVVTVVARMLRIKGIDLAVDAVRRARALGAPVRLRLVGDDDPTNPSTIAPEVLRSWAAEPGFEWLGRRKDVDVVWRETHIALLPSRGGEGLPKALLEAAATGRPLVGTDVPGIRDLVINDVTGILVPSDDPERLCQALVTLASDPSLRLRLGMGARTHVERGYGDAAVARQVGEIHARLAKK
jgi:glycosyltransferase involved in cell wall biosynthesis